MVYARKMPVKKKNLITNYDFLTTPWSTFSFLFNPCNWVDIAFGVYKENSIKASEPRRRMADMKTIISGFDQSLPRKIDRFFPLSKNKTSPQQLFTMWILSKVKNGKFYKLILRWCDVC